MTAADVQPCGSAKTRAVSGCAPACFASRHQRQEADMPGQHRSTPLRANMGTCAHACEPSEHKTPACRSCRASALCACGMWGLCKLKLFCECQLTPWQSWRQGQLRGVRTPAAAGWQVGSWTRVLCATRYAHAADVPMSRTPLQASVAGNSGLSPCMPADACDSWKPSQVASPRGACSSAHSVAPLQLLSFKIASWTRR